jgi:surface polysaccharide O-acyltransferase-like enzyme
MTELANKNLIRHLHAFRGFAIINVVAVHAWETEMSHFGGVVSDADVARLFIVNETLFRGSTIYFALISGLLFSLVLRPRGWLAFFRSKAVNVVSPYIVMTLLFTLYGHDDSRQLAAFAGSSGDYVAAVVTNLFTGGAFYQLWYIPILLVLYLATPLVAWLCDRPKANWLVFLVMAAPLAVSALWDVVSWGRVVYYLGAYTVGVFIGTRYEAALRLLGRYHAALLTVVAVTTLGLLWSYFGDVEWIGFVSIHGALFYVQKLAIAGIVIVWFRAYEEHLPQWLMTVAACAFSIYFLHAFVLMALVEVQQAVGLVLAEGNATGMILGGAVLLVVSIGVVVAFSSLMKGLLGSRARAVIGA